MKAVELLDEAGEEVSPILLTNVGSLKVELGGFGDAKGFYQRALT